LRAPLLALLVTAAVSAGVSAGEAQSPEPAPAFAARAVRTTARATIDGLLDEPFWQEIAPITNFTQREPREGEPVSERTEARIAYNEDFLYFGFTLYDSEPEKIVRSVLQREGPSQNDDHVLIGLDTYYDRRNAYIFGLNPFGTQEDAIVTDEGPPNWNWEGVYWSEARITETGWTLEVAIPFSTIRLADVPNPVMGLALYRQIRRKNEEAFWPPIPRNFSSQFYQVSQYGLLEGLGDLKAGRNLQIKPYLLLGGQNPNRRADPVTELTRNIGMDVRYAVTRDATLDLTYNTDFAQVEADNVQVNLTRFSLFFPEKREFFLERNGLFAFGAPNTFQQGQAGFRQPLESATFFSRRIGLTQPIIGGGRYSGRTGRFTIGVMDIQTKAQDEREGQNYGVARVRADLSSRSSVGAIVTNVQGDGTENRAAGADMALRFWGASALTGWISHVWDPRFTSSTGAGNANLFLRNDRYSYQFDYTNIGRHFDPAMGFVRRFDMVRYTNDVGFNPRPRSWPAIRQFRFNAGGFQIVGQDGQKQSTQTYVKAAAVFKYADEAGVWITNDSDRPADPFRLVRAIVPAGAYAYTHPRFYVNTTPARRLSQQFSWETGGFYGGTKTSFVGQVLYKPWAHLQVTYNYQRDRIDIPFENGRFSTRLDGITLFAAVGRNLYSNTLIQYDSVSRQLQSNVRIRWIHRPGSDLFLVFNTARKLLEPFEPRAVTDDSRAGVMKITYLVRF